MNDPLDANVMKYHNAIQLFEAAGSKIMADFYRNILYSYLLAKGFNRILISV